MKLFCTYLLAFCVLSGICSRMVSIDRCESLCKSVTQHAESGHDHDHACCSHGKRDHSPELPGKSSQEPQCPMDHHHHVGCAHVMPLVADIQSRISFCSIGFSRLLLSIDEASAPETPVFELDKPPLI